MADRDRQRSRVYAWEDRVVAPRDSSVVLFPAAQGMVDAIWSEMGLLYPPRVTRLPAQARCRIADADRLELRLPRATPSWCVLHEIAHAMTTTHDGRSDGHGAEFIGIYVDLLVRYLRFDAVALRTSLQETGVQFRVGARAVFADG